MILKKEHYELNILKRELNRSSVMNVNDLYARRRLRFVEVINTSRIISCNPIGPLCILSRSKENKPGGLPGASNGIMHSHEYKYCALRP